MDFSASPGFFETILPRLRRIAVLPEVYRRSSQLKCRKANAWHYLEGINAWLLVRVLLHQRHFLQAFLCFQIICFTCHDASPCNYR
jgi:hypothetical protein